MSFTISDLRIKYGSVYLTEIDNGLIVPWKPLSIGDFNEYDTLFRTQIYPKALLENEIFVKCVLDPYLVKNLDKQNAGIITTVVNDIMHHSGPVSIEHFNQSLEFARSIAMQPIHQMVKCICLIFGAYSPDDVYKMEYSKLLQMFALAEEELIRMGVLNQPFAIIDPNESEIEKKPEKKKIDPEKLKQAFEEQSIKSHKKNAVQAEEEDYGSTNSNNFVVSKQELRSPLIAGNDVEDAPLFEHKLIEEAKVIYKDYIEKMKKGEKITSDTVKQKVNEKFKKGKK